MGDLLKFKNHGYGTKSLAQEAKDSLFILCKLLGFDDVNHKTHDSILSMLEDNQKLRKLICVPRGCLKSSIGCVAYPIWLLLNNPNIRILIDSELYTNSCTFLREIKQHMKSARFLRCFGNLEGDIWTQGEIIIKTRTKRLKEASVSCGGIGTTRVGQHYDVIIADDLNSHSNSNTSENAQKVIDHYKYNISILEPGGIYVIIGTRYASNDIIGHILQNEEHDYIGGLLA